MCSSCRNQLNTFLVNAPIIYSLKTPENQIKGILVFSGVTDRNIGLECVNML